MSEQTKGRVILYGDDEVVLSGPISRKTHFTLYISGPWTVAACNRLVEQLHIQREWLRDDEEAEAAAKEQQPTDEPSEPDAPPTGT